MCEGNVNVAIWVLGVVALLGNTLVIIWRLRDSRDSKVRACVRGVRAGGCVCYGGVLVCGGFLVCVCGV